MGTCHTCGLQGHSSKFCPETHAPGTPGVFHGQCSYCKVKGHKAEYCPKKAKEGGLNTVAEGDSSPGSGDSVESGVQVPKGAGVTAAVSHGGPVGHCGGVQWDMGACAVMHAEETEGGWTQVKRGRWKMPRVAKKEWKTAGEINVINHK